MKLRQKKAQNFTEYAIVLSLVIAAIAGMQVYVQRGLQGRYKDVSDNVMKTIQNKYPAMIPQEKFIKQYEPYYAESNINLTDYSNIKTSYNKNGYIFEKKIIPTENFSQRAGTQVINDKAGKYEKY